MIAAVTPTTAGAAPILADAGLGRVSASFNRGGAPKRSEESTAYSIRWRIAKPIRERHWTDEDFEAEAERLDREIAEYIAAHGLSPRDDASVNGVFRSSELGLEAELTTPKPDISKLLH